MTKITRSHLIKSIVAEEMRLLESGESYTKTLSDVYKVWENKSSDELCSKFYKINNNSITVSMLSHDA